MIVLHIPVWKLLVYGGALSLLGVFMFGGQAHKHRLRRRIDQA